MSEYSIRNDPHLFLEHAPYEVSDYVFHDNRIEIRDAAWEPCEIGDQPGDEVLLDLSKNALVRRTMSVEQLTLDRYTETIPNAAIFSRWEHMWGSVAFIRNKSRDLGIDPRDSLILQLRTFVSDLGHTVYSHLGDWMFQGAGGSENQHDIELLHLLDVSGINSILESHGISPQEVVFPEISDWVECPSPDLCVDRVDYGVREIKRWLDLSPSVHSSISPGAFKVDDKGQLVMRSHQDALNFSKAYLLLPTEHWLEPVHRLQLYFQERLVKRVLTNDETGLFASDMDPPNDYYPRDYMYSFDFDITWEQVRSWDSYTTNIRTFMEDIGRYSRRNFVSQREGQLRSFFSEIDKQRPLPIPQQPYGPEMYQQLPMLPPNISLRQVASKDDIKQPRRASYIDIYLPPLKPRYIDPLFLDKDGRTKRLSDEDMYYKSLLAQQKEILDRAYAARVYLNPDTAKLMKKTDEEIDAQWSDALRRPRMGREQFSRMLGETAMLAANHRLARIIPGEISDFSFWPG
jgi:hypothetical protein